MLMFLLGVSITINLFFVTVIILWINYKNIKFGDDEIVDREVYEDFFDKKTTKKK